MNVKYLDLPAAKLAAEGDLWNFVGAALDSMSGRDAMPDDYYRAGRALAVAFEIEGDQRRRWAAFTPRRERRMGPGERQRGAPAARAAGSARKAPTGAQVHEGLRLLRLWAAANRPVGRSAGSKAA